MDTKRMAVGVVAVGVLGIGGGGARAARQREEWQRDWVAAEEAA